MMDRIAIGLIALGAIVIAWGLHYPQFYDPNWQDRFNHDPWLTAMNQATRDPDKFSAMSTEWFVAREKALTPRDACFDHGLSILLLGCSLMVLSRSARVTAADGKRFFQSPATLGRFVFLCSAAWLSIVPAEWIYLGYTSFRNDYPWFGDVIFIGCAGIAVWGIIGLPIVILSTRWILRHSELPVPVFSKPIFGRFSIRMFVVCAAFLPVLLVSFIGLAEVPTLVPSVVGMIYLLLSARAAVASNRITSP